VSASIELEYGSYAPGAWLRGRVVLMPFPGDERRRVELSVLWETYGKGDTDQWVLFCRVLADGDPAAGTATHTFEAQVPVLPLSYDGTVVSLRWLVRVRRFATLGSDAVIDQPFLVAWPRVIA
jgi:hypothetical protein